MQINYSKLAFDCHLSGCGINLTDKFEGADHVMLYGDFKTVKVIKKNFENNPTNNESLAVNFPFEYVTIKHKDRVVPTGIFWFQGFDIIKGEEERIPDYESTGKNIREACLKLGLKEKYGNREHTSCSL